MTRDEKYMRAALEQAQLAAQEGEVPVGAVVVYQDEVIATGRNRRERGKNALCHAELEAIDAACRRLGGWRLWQCELYVTLEPCPMCAGAIINARIPRLVFGAADAKAGSCGSVVNLFSLPYNHSPQVEQGVLAQECGDLLSEFFCALRAKKKAQKAAKGQPVSHESTLTP
ncbi:MAG TPA: nucleoside deaminase [Candidatus Gallacutalibacter stercoravium]|nr:nucleoside deaminase [Candidatus Gallacutalibacter stercoravium]